MADTESLTRQHQQAQAQIRAQAIRDFTLLWPIWKGDEKSFTELVAASIILVRAYRQISAAAAAAFYEAFRGAAAAAGVPATVLSAEIPDAQIATSLYVTGRDALRKALDAGQSPDNARATTFVRSSGAVSRHVVDAGRQTILDSVAADEQALGWARVTDGDPCYFCLTLASRGAVYKSEQSADFKAHDHCGCTAMPVFKGTEIPDLQRWREIYNRAQNEGESSGLLQPGENSSKARLNAVRQFLAATAEDQRTQEVHNMADDQESTDEQEHENENENEQQEREDGGEQKTFSPDYVKKLRDEAAKHRREKQELADRLKAIDDKDKSEAQKLEERATAAEQRAAAAESSALRLEVALDKAPEGMATAQVKKLAKRLTGSTQEELEADAEELFATFAPNDDGDDGQGPPRSPKEHLRSGAGTSSEDDDDDEMDPDKLAELVPRRFKL